MTRIDFVAVWLKISYSDYQNKSEGTVKDGSIGFFFIFVLRVISEKFENGNISSNLV